jgi:hypothetical protein
MSHPIPKRTKTKLAKVLNNEAAAASVIISAAPSQEEFDAAMSAASDAVLALINASPRTPTSKKIRQTIETTMRERFDVAQEKAEEEEAPITGPIAINFDWEGHHHNLQIFNIGLSLLAKDDASLREGIRKMLRGELAGEIEADGLDRLLADLESCEEKFGAMAHFAGVAKARFALQALKMAGQSSARHGELTQTVLQAGGQS